MKRNKSRFAACTVVALGLIFTSLASADTNVGGFITSSTTWLRSASPYVVTSTVYVQATSDTAPVPTLTIQDGVTVKFQPSTALIVGSAYPGALNALGTNSSQIVFKSSNANPTPGAWEGIKLMPKTVSASTILRSFKILDAAEGLHIDSCAPEALRGNIEKNTVGISTSGTAAPKLYAIDFVNNTSGMSNNQATNKVTATLNYWSSPDGPDSGQSVSGNVEYDPWIIAPFEKKHYFESFTIQNRKFDPAFATTNMTFGTDGSGSWTVTFFNSVCEQTNSCRKFTGSGKTGAVSWDGKIGGVVQPDGGYRFEIVSVNNGGKVAGPARGYATIDSAYDLAITSGPTASPTDFNPNTGGSSTVTATINYDSATWALKFKKSDGTVVRTVNGSGTSVYYVWNGDGQVDGIYTAEVTATVGSAQAVASTPVTIDRVSPSISITSPTNNQVLSNVFQGVWIGEYLVHGSYQDPYGIQNWDLEYGVGATPTVWIGVSPAPENSPPDVLGLWQTLNEEENLANGVYTIRLTATDEAGNTAQLLRPVTLANFKVSPSTYQFNPTGGQTVTYTTEVPNPLNLFLTISIYNQAGTKVKDLLVSQLKAPGIYSDIVWNGTNQSSQLVLDGPYFYKATVVDQASSAQMIWDLTGVDIGELEQFYHPTLTGLEDYYDNQALELNYTLNFPARVTLILSRAVFLHVPEQGPSHMAIPTGCQHEANTCVAIWEYQHTGAHTFNWPGVDGAGNLVTGIEGVTVWFRQDGFSRNAVVLYGTRPTILNVTLDPPIYNPYREKQRVLIDFQTAYDTRADIQVEFTNQKCLVAGNSWESCTLRTESNNYFPQLYTAVLKWNGRAVNDTGVWASPGVYIVTVKVTDSTIGSQSVRQALTVLNYNAAEYLPE